MKERTALHTLLMGATGAGKDTFAATWPGPRMVWHLDGFGQEIPYLKGAQNVGELQTYNLGGHVVTYRDVIAADGGFTRIEYYSSDNPTMAMMSQVLETRIGFFSGEQAAWKTLICGSLSAAAVENRLYEQFVLNPNYKDPRKWYGAATDYLERLIFTQKALRINTVFICHIGKEKDEIGGDFLFTPDLPGRLSDGAGKYFNEMYRLFVWRDGEGKAHRYLQTDNDGRFQCKTHIDAPNPLGPNPTYEGLWVNWK